MAGRANNLLASVFTPPPPKPKFAGISTRRVLFLHNRTCFSIATKATTIPRKIRFQIRRSSLTTPSSQDPVLEEDSSPERSEVEDEDGGGENGGDDGEGWSWTLSLLLFGFWAGLMYYVLILAPNQTPVLHHNCIHFLLLSQIHTQLHLSIPFSLHKWLNCSVFCLFFYLFFC